MRRGMIQAFANKKANVDQGLALPLVVVVGFILAIGGMALIARAFSGLARSIRSEQSRQAREIAEAGMAETLENLNRQFNYLLINCYQNSNNECQNIVFTSSPSGTQVGLWNAPRYPSSVCPGAQRLPYTQFTKATTQPKGEYKVVSYVFDGTQFYGGKGTLTIEGTRRSESNHFLSH